MAILKIQPIMNLNYQDFTIWMIIITLNYSFSKTQVAFESNCMRWSAWTDSKLVAPRVRGALRRVKVKSWKAIDVIHILVGKGSINFHWLLCLLFCCYFGVECFPDFTRYSFTRLDRALHISIPWRWHLSPTPMDSEKKEYQFININVLQIYSREGL